MQNKLHRAITLIMAVVLFSISTVSGVKAEDMGNPGFPGGFDFKPIVPKAYMADVIQPYNVNPGDLVNVSIPVKISNYSMRKPVIEVDFGKMQGFRVEGKVKCVNEKGEELENLTISDKVFLKFQVRIPLSAKRGTYKDIPIKFITLNSFGDYAEVVLEQVSKLTFVISSQKDSANFSLVDAVHPVTIKEGQDVELSLELYNKGDLAAEDVNVVLTGYESTLLPDGSQPEYFIGDVKGGESCKADFSFISARNLQTGVLQLVATVTYKNPDGTAAEPQKFTISMQTVSKADLVNKVNRPQLQVVSVEYPHYTVKSGDKFDVIYTFKNTGTEAAKNITVDTTGYSEAGLKPVKAYDKLRKNKLKVGKTFKVKRTFKATDTVTTGLKPITINYTYYSAKDKALTTQITDSMNVYIDSKNKEDGQSGEIDNSMPRLTISKYDTGKKKIMAGKIFNFTFEILNPHPNVAAENIVATISSADNSFSIVEGSASFFIDSLKPGQKKKCSIPLKTKGDIATNGYDLMVTFEYEYLAKELDKSNALVKKQSKIEEKLKLQVYSNDRPMLSNISVGSGEPPVVMEPTAISFDFNNMGKSTLYNVTAKVKGDFQPTNEVLIIGNVEAGAGRSWSIDVTPQKEGQGQGIITISYEDGNGNVSSYDTKFEGMVNAPIQDEGMNGNMPEMPAESGPKEKIPMWAFVIIEVIVFFAGMLITRKIFIKKYKKKKLEQVMKEDEEL